MDKVFTVKEVLRAFGEGGRINISSLGKESCSGRLKDILVDGFELELDATSVKKTLVTDAGLVIKILKNDFTKNSPKTPSGKCRI